MKQTIFIIIVIIGQFGCSQNIENQMKKSTRFKNGWEKLKEIDGEAGEKVFNNLKDISPDLGNYIIEYAFGDVYTRKGINLKSKEIAVVAALTAMGNAQPQLKVHINGALNTGSSINEIKEVILQMSIYSGFPNCINGMNALKEVLNERHAKGFTDKIGSPATEIKETNRLKIGEEELSKLDSLQVNKLKETYNNFSPELVKLALEFGYGDIYSRDNLSKQHRQIATIAALTAMGNAQVQLKFHINAGMNIGLTKENIEDIMLLMTIYSGFPSAINGINCLKEVVNERNY